MCHADSEEASAISPRCENTSAGRERPTDQTSKPGAVEAGLHVGDAEAEDVGDLCDVLVAATRKVEDHDLTGQLVLGPEHPRERVGRLQRGDDPLGAGKHAERVQHLGVGHLLVGGAPGGREVGVLGTDARVVEAGRDRVGLGDLTVLVAEDAAFWDHEGVDYAELQKSIEIDFARGEFVRGASTITQQLAKNLYLSPSRDPVRKLRELIIARRMEAELEKARILEIYLNIIEWGNGIYGVEAASRTYFGMPAANLGPVQSALLVGAIGRDRRGVIVAREEYGEAGHVAIGAVGVSGATSAATCLAITASVCPPRN